MRNFMGTKLGTVNGNPFLAIRVKAPMFPSVRSLRPTAHCRFLIAVEKGQFWSPFVRKIEPVVLRARNPTGTSTPSAARTFKGFKLTCDPLVSDYSFALTGVLVVDLGNQVTCRPCDFFLPFEVFAGEPVTFSWSVLCPG